MFRAKIIWLLDALGPPRDATIEGGHDEHARFGTTLSGA